MASTKKYLISTVLNNECKIIFIDELSVENYLNACCVAFNLPNDVNLLFEFRTNLGALFDEKSFELVVENFSTSASFYIDLHVDFNQNDNNIRIVTPNEIRKYLQTNGGVKVLSEHASNKCLIKTSQNLLIRLCANYGFEIFGQYPKKENKSALAKSILFLFPYLKCNEEKKEHTYLLYNSDNGGYLGQAMKNLRVGKRNKEKKNALNPNSSTSSHNNSIEPGASSDICSSVPENINDGDFVLVEKDL